MPEILENRLKDLRRRLRQMVWLYGLSWLVAVVFGATLAAGLLDWSIRLEDAGIRLILGLGILISAAWIGWKLLIRPLRRQISDVEIALRIERRYPGFNDSLASTVQFLAGQNDPKLGSPEMQKQVVERTIHQVERINLSDLIETRRVRKVAFAAVGICLLAAMIAGLNQAAAATALHRLVFPFANRPWPKTTELRLVNEDLEPLEYHAGEPLRLAEGDSIEVYVEDQKGRLPEDVRMEYRFDNESEEVIAETLRRTTLPGSDGYPRDVCVATLIATKGPMFFRAVGGDDQEMPWQKLEVVPPPEVETLQLTLTPPAYTGEKPETLPEGVGHVRGLVGTRVELKATTNKSLESARLRVKDFPAVEVPISNTGRKIEAEFTITEPGVYSWWLDLTDRKGFQNANASRYEVRGTADLVPDVWIDEPPRDKNVTPTAMVPILVGAKDDLGLKQIRLQYKVGEDPETPLATILLFEGEDRPLEQRVEYEWELAGLNLKPGQVVVFHAEALDDYDLDGEHVGRSTVRKLMIVSPEEKSAELTFHQGGLIEELDAAHTMQTQTHDQVEQLKIQLSKAGELRPQDIDLLKRLEIEQRQIEARLSHPGQGLTAHAEELLKELENNKIDDPDMEARLRGIAVEVEILQEDHLTVIEEELTNARKLAQTKLGLAPEDGEPKPANARDEQTSLERADGHQQAVLDSLGELLAQLSEWRVHRDLTGEVGDLVRNQEAINRDTGEVGRRTFGKRPNDLTPQEQADLARLADRQRKQSQRVSELNKSFDELIQKLQETSPQAAEILTDAEAHLREQAVAGNLQEAANQITRNQIGEAAGEQNEALADLNELSDILKNRGVSDTETLVKKLKEARSELEELRKRQEELNKKTEQAEQLTDPGEKEKALERLRQEQQEIRRQISSLARRLRRLQAQQPGSSLRRAASRMEQAERLLQENLPNQAEAEQQDILEDLKQAERELAEAEQEAQERLAREMLERIADELKSMIGRQQTVIDETNRLEALRRERGNWTRAQLKSLRDLAEVQRNLKTETDRLVEVVKAAEVFALALQGAARDMERAADRLEKRLTDGETVARETDAKHRFEDLVTALDTEKDQNANAEQKQEAGEQDQPADAGPQTDGIPHLAQLKMLKTLQEDLIRRTEDLDKLRQEAGELSEEEQQEVDRLAGEQGLLADLTRNLTAQFQGAFQAEPAPPEPKQPMEQKPEQQPEPETADPKKPSLEDQLNRDLDLDGLLPEAEPAKEPEPEAQANRLPPESKIFLAAAQVDLEKTSPEGSQPQNPPAEEPKQQPAAKDQKVTEGLTGKQPGGGDLTENPLEEAISGMRSAQERIQGQDTGQETREIQEDVVANLQKLIDLMKNNQNRPPSPSSNSPKPQDQSEQPQGGNPMQEPPMPEGQPDEQTKDQENQPARQESENPRQSTDDQRGPGNAHSRLLPRPEMKNEVWGHLPPSVRDELLNINSDKYLPKYEDLARRYFEALAEPDRNSNMKSPR